jgi:hypothetical protein
VSHLTVAAITLAASAQIGTSPALHRDGERVTRAYGHAMSHGATPAESAEAFLENGVQVFGVERADLAARATRPGHVVPLGYDAATGTYEFTSLHYTQVAGSVPVFRTRLTLLVRNDPGSPLVLAAADLRDLGAFEPPDAAGDLDPGTVVWAGLEDAPAPARLARVEIADDLLRVIDLDTGAILHEESTIIHAHIEGVVQGLATVGPGADICSEETPVPMPYARVTVGEQVVFADEHGAFEIGDDGPGPFTFEARLRGPYFRVFNEAGVDAAVSRIVTPPAFVDLTLNESNEFEFVRSQVNAYLHANIVRDFVLATNPSYPTIAEQVEFPVNVNRNDNCNAFYTIANPSINFFTSGEDCPNTAFDTIVYHEYGHHLVQMAGSGQGAYGEGMSDTVAVVLTDHPNVGYGWRSDCSDWLRSADNDCTYSATECTTNCGSQVHACGRLLSGSVWSMRNELAATEPADYRQIVASLTLDSILLHTGSGIDPSITVDVLTLDDDNETILDGTPHYHEIADAFGGHGLTAPPLTVVSFALPDGLPEIVAPSGDSAVRVEVEPDLGTPQPGTGVLHVSAAGPHGPFTAVPMIELAPNVYDAVFPPAECSDTVHFFFSAQSSTGHTQTYPPGAPGGPDAPVTLATVAATVVTDVLADPFESDLGWSVASDASVTGGAWDRGVPVDCDRGDPPADADGSGQCYLTQNGADDDCNSDVDGGATVLTSPSFDAGDPGTYVSYQRWLSNDHGNNPWQDVLVVEISGDGGTTWAEIETVGPDGDEASGGWNATRVRVGDFVEAGATTHVRFVVADADPASIVEAAVDDVRVARYTCGACPGDANGDGVVGVQDLIAVIVAWGTSDPDADVDGSGVVDVQDIVQVVVAWGPCSD